MSEAVSSRDLVPAEDHTILIPTVSAQGLSSEVVYNSPINAPVSQGQQLGELIVKPEGLPEYRVPLVAENAVAEGGFMVRITAVAQVLLRQWIDNRSGNEESAS